MKIKYLLFASVFITTLALGQQNKPSNPGKGSITMERFIGDYMVVDISTFNQLNRGSTLTRDAYLIKDSLSPLGFIGNPTPKVIYYAGDRGQLGKLNYTMNYSVKAADPIVAFELKVIAIDIFGRLIKTLVATRIRDIPDTFQDSAEWRIWSENEAAEAYAFITYISKVRMANGKYYEIDQKTVLEHAAKVSSKLTEADLEPKREAAK